MSSRRENWMHQWRWLWICSDVAYFFVSLLYELIEILDTDELNFPPRMIRSILCAGMRTRPTVELLQWSGEAALWCLRLWDCSPLVTSVVAGLSGNESDIWVFLKVAIWASWSLRRFISSRSQVMLSRSCSACPRSRSNRACCFANSSMSANIWKSWAS